MRVLVTGHQGHIGTVLVTMLLEAGHSVVGLDSDLFRAALSNDPLGDLNPQITHEINHFGSVRLAELAKRAGVSRFLYSSSCGSYRDAGDDLVDETAELLPPG